MCRVHRRGVVRKQIANVPVRGLACLGGKIEVLIIQPKPVVHPLKKPEAEVEVVRAATPEH